MSPDKPNLGLTPGLESWLRLLIVMAVFFVAAMLGFPFNSSLLRCTAGVFLALYFAWELRIYLRSRSGRGIFSRIGTLIVLVISLLVSLRVLVPLSLFSKKIPSDVRAALQNPEHAVLYSIDPYIRRKYGDDNKLLPEPRPGEVFHDHTVLGTLELDGKKASRAAGAFQYSLTWPDVSEFMCFDPRHGLRVTSGGHVYDFLLCYECRQIVVFRDGVGVGSRTASGSPQTLNALLTEANVPLPTR